MTEKKRLFVLFITIMFCLIFIICICIEAKVNTFLNETKGALDNEEFEKFCNIYEGYKNNKFDCGNDINVYLVDLISEYSNIDENFIVNEDIGINYKTVICRGNITDLYADENGIIFVEENLENVEGSNNCYLKNYSIKTADLFGNNETTILLLDTNIKPGYARPFAVKDDFIYYTNPNDGGLYRVNRYSGENKVISSNYRCTWYNVESRPYIAGERIFFVDYNISMMERFGCNIYDLYAMDLEGNNCEKIAEGIIDFEVGESNIILYFANNGYDGKENVTCKIADLDGKIKYVVDEVNSDAKLHFVAEENNCVYFAAVKTVPINADLLLYDEVVYAYKYEHTNGKMIYLGEV